MVMSDGFMEQFNQSIISPISIPINIKLSDIEKIVILETLKRKNYNRTSTAQELGIGIRTLQRKLKKYGATHLKRSNLNIA